MPILQWLNKEEAVVTARNCSYRLLEQVPELSYGEPNTENMLIQGDNLEALKALIPTHAGRVKCIFIDPPYNTKSAFEHYDDNLEHSKWLSMMYPRLELLHQLLAEEGSIWITIDDNESHYLKVIMDEIFGRKSFISSICWQSRYSRSNDSNISLSHNTIHLYAKQPELWKTIRNRLPRTGEQAKQYKNPDNDPNGPWRAIPWDAPNLRENLSYPITTPTGKVRFPPAGRCWSRTEEQWLELVDKGLAYFGKAGSGAPSFKSYLKDASGIVPNTWWPHEEAGHTDEAKKELHLLFGKDNAFGTPKPERLMQRILHIATNEGDLVLDSFLGSGTTAAATHKMNRKYIAIELGEHAVTHCQPRMVKVIDGEQGGISKGVNWQGGGGFNFYRLGEVIFNENGSLKEGISFNALASHIWYSDTKTSLEQTEKSPLLGVHNGVAYYLLYNGILGDKRPDGGNVLTSKVLAILPEHPTDPENGKKVIFGETSRMGAARLKKENIVFKQIPYDVKGR
ncbi:Type III restriction-modification system methylation subunit [Pseudoalteromonas luteoviolacea B = ATCC 29581]|nr:Type III restriction-modification system methylation subunit [Pseudoalteromonas luteoviolacea B = ATCC 29581]